MYTKHSQDIFRIGREGFSMSGRGRLESRVMVPMACTIAMVLWAAAAAGSDGIQKREGIVTADVVSVRARPGTNFEVIHELRDGAVVQVVNETDGWLGIIVPNGAEAWVATSQLEDNRVIGNKVPVFAGPGMIYSIYASLAKNDRVSILEVKDGRWARILPPPDAVVWVDGGNIDLKGVNTPPTISSISSQTTSEDTPLYNLAFTVNEGEYSFENSQALTVRATSSNPTLVPAHGIDIEFTDGAGDADGGSITITPAADRNGTAVITLVVDDGEYTAEKSFDIQVKPVNDPPTLSSIAEQTIDEDGELVDVRFTADEGGDETEDRQVLKITAASSDQRLVPNANITVNFSDGMADAQGGTISVRPSKDQSGETIITVTAYDGTEITETQFRLIVRAINDSPTISDMPDQSINEDETVANIEFIADEGGGKFEDEQTLRVTVSSSNPSLIPQHNIILDFYDDFSDAKGGTMTLTPEPDQNGVAAITLTVSDGDKTVEKAFRLTVRPVNDPPEISQIANSATDEDTVVTDIRFTVDEGGGADEDSQAVTISAASSNPALVRDDAIHIEFSDDGDAAGGYLVITPTADQNGAATITVTASDGEKTVATRFQITVNAVNDAPVISAIGDQIAAENAVIDTIAFTVDEGGGADENLQSLTILAVSSNIGLVPNENIRIAFSDGAGDAVGGSLSITPLADQNGTTNIVVTVSDGAAIAESQFVLTVSGVNSVPEISDIPDQTVFEDSALTNIPFTVDEGGGSDEDHQVLEVTAVSSNNAIVPNANIRVDFTDDQYDAVGGSITLTPAPDANGTVTITVTVDDGVSTAQDTFKVTVQSVNDAPVLSAIADQTTMENRSVSDIRFTVGSGGGKDEQVQPVTVSASSSNPALVPDANIVIDFNAGDPDNRVGAITIIPTADQNGVVVITLTASDGHEIVSRSFNLRVQNQNNPPSLSDFADMKTNEDTPISGIAFTVDEGGGQDENEQVVTIAATSSNQMLVPDANILVNFFDDSRDAAGGTISITPATDRFGATVITVTADDGIASVQRSFELTVNPVNDAPTIAGIADQFVSEGAAVTQIAFTVDEGGGDDEDTQVLVVKASSSNTALVDDSGIRINFFDDQGDAVGGTLDITPASGRNGSATITVTVDDGANVVQEKFNVLIDSIDNPPTISTIEDQTIDENGFIEGLAFTVDEGGGSDEDRQALSITVKTTNSQLVPYANIMVNFSDNTGDATGGVIDIKPAADHNGSATITIVVNDGASSVEERFVLTVNDINDPPYISPIADQSLDEDGSLYGIDFTVDEGGGADEDVQTVMIRAESSNLKLIPNENIVVNFSDDTGDAGNGSLDIAPAFDQNGVSRITLTVSDGDNTVTRAFDVRVRAVNDPPIYQEIPDYETYEDIPVVGIILALDEGGGQDENVQVLKVTAASSETRLIPQSAIKINFEDSVNDAEPGTLDITPQADRNGVSTISLTISDGVHTVQESFVVNVIAVNDLPVISRIKDQTTVEDQPVTGIRFTVDEGGGADEDQQQLLVSAGSSNPKLINDANIHIDFFDDTSDAGDGNISIIPNPDQFGQATITLTVYDGIDSAQESFVVTVNAENDAPVIKGLANQRISEDAAEVRVPFTVDEGGGADEDVQVLDIDVISSNTKLIPDENIIVEFNDDATDAGEGVIRIRTVADEYGSSTIRMTVSDGLLTATDTFEVNVSSVNDPPTAYSGAVTTTEDTAVTGTLRGADLDGNPLTFSILAPATRGTVILTNPSTGLFSYTPDPDLNGTDSFSFKVSDGSDESDAATLTITVTPVDDPPVISSVANQQSDEDQRVTGIVFTVDEGGGDDEDSQVLDVRVSSSNTDLVPDRNIILRFTDTDGPESAGTIELFPAPEQFGVTTITIVAGDGNHEVQEVFTLTVAAVNDPPTLSEIAARTTAEDSVMRDIPFSVDEGGGPDEDTQVIVVRAVSSNKTLIPDANITVNVFDDDGDAGEGTLDIRPAADKNGSSLITVSVSDGTSTVKQTFEMTVTPVNDPPVISPLDDVVVDEDSVVDERQFKVDEGGDRDEDAQALTLSVTSSNAALLPEQSIRLNFSDGAGDAGWGTISLSPVPDEYGESTVTIKVDDGIDSVSESFRLTVNSVNDLPLLSAFTDQEIDEDGEIEGIAFTADEGGGSNEDVQVLGVTATSSNSGLIPDDNITVSFRDDDGDAVGGTLDIRAAAEEFGVSTITVTADDGTDRISRTFNIKVNAVDDPPEVSDVPDQVIREDEPLAGLAFIVDEGGGRDEDYQDLRITAVSSNKELVPDEAISVTFTGASGQKRGGSISIRPVADRSGSTTVTISVTDGASTVHDTFNLTVESVNDPPFTEDVSLTTIEDTPVSGVLVAGDRDGDALTFEIVTPPDKGEVVITDAQTGAFTYTPKANVNGNDRFQYLVNDGAADANTSTVTIAIQSVDDAPALSRFSNLSVDEDSTITGIKFSVDEGGGRDEDVQVVGITAFSSNSALIPDNAIRVNFSDDSGDATGGTIDIKPVANGFGEAEITVSAGDGAAIVQSTFKVTVKSVNDPPTLSAIGDQKTREDVPLKGIEFTVDEGGGFDEDSQVLTISVASSNKELVPNANIHVNFFDDSGDAAGGSLDIFPVADAFGKTTITVLVNDGEHSVKETFELTVGWVNDVPVVSGDAITTAEDTAVEGLLKAVDLDNDPLTFEMVEYPRNGAVEITDGAIGAYRYTPKADAAGSDSFSFKVNDGKGESNVGVIDVTIAPVDDPPVVSAIADQFAVEDRPILDISFTCDEGGGGDEDVQTLTATVVSTNPELFPAEDIRVIFSDAEQDASGGTIDITPAADLSGSAVVTLSISDGNATCESAFTVTVDAVNDPPVVSAIPHQRTDEDVRLTGIEFEVDEGGGADEDRQGVTIVVSSSNDVLLPAENIIVKFADNSGDAGKGTIDLAPLPDAFGAAVVTVTVNDGIESASVAFEVDVASVNDRPIAEELTFTVAEDGVLDGGLTARDADGDALEFSVVAQPTKGQVEMVDAEFGVFRYTPRTDAVGRDSFSWKASDGVAESDTIIALITIEPVDDPPTISAVPDQVMKEDSVITGLAFTADEGGGADEDSQVLAITVKSTNTTLVATENIKVDFVDDKSNAGGGTITITPDPNETGTISVTLTVSDGAHEASTTFLVTIEETNDPPTIAPIADQATNEDQPIVGIAFDADEGGGDGENAQVLRVSARSSDQTLIPDDTITVHFFDGREDADAGTIDITPAPDQSGEATITVVADDGVSVTQETFKLRVKPVNDPPIIGKLPDQSTDEDTLISGIVFTVDEGGDADEDHQVVKVKAKSSNTDLVPNGNIRIDFSDDRRDAKGGTIDILPATDRTGIVTITITASDGAETSDMSFNLAVLPVNDPPVITGLSDCETPEDQALKDLAFEVDEGGGADEDKQVLTISATSSNLRLVPNENVHVNFTDNKSDAGGGTIDIYPIRNQFGKTTITLTINDDFGFIKHAFDLRVVTVNDLPRAFDYEVTTEPGMAVSSLLRGNDPDGARVTYEIVDVAGKGKAKILNPRTGAFVYTPKPKATGADLFTFKVNDGADDSNVATIKINILAE